MRLLFFFLFFCRHIIEGLVWALSVREKEMPQFTPPEIKKRHAGLLDIRDGCSNTKISDFLRVSIKDNTED